MANGNLTAKDKLDYAYKWFEYHASQRLVAFDFLLVIMGVLSVGYYKAFDGREYWYALAVAIFGVIVATAFLILEKRNEDLVNTGRAALRDIENMPEFSSLPKDQDPCRLLNEDRKRFVLMSHKFWLRTIEIVLLLLFLVAAVVSWLKIAEERCPKKPTPKIEAYYQCPTLNKTDEMPSSPEQSRRTQES